jgi:hypothetical protein
MNWTVKLERGFSQHALVRRKNRGFARKEVCSKSLR